MQGSGSGDAAPLADAFATAWRRYRIDLLATLIVFAIAALAAGRVWRFPFDDEIYTIAPHVPERAAGSLWAMTRFYLNGGDFHPPTVFLFFSALYRVGIGEAALRLASLAMTGFALTLWQLLALAMAIARGAGPTIATRLAAVLIFGFAPLPIGQGDAIRWYPLFALCVGLSVALYLTAGSRAFRLVSAVPLGLAISINLIAPLVILPLALYRYLLEREWRVSFDLKYWGIVTLAAAPGLYTAVSVFRRQIGVLRGDVFGHSPVLAISTDALGIFGGSAVGVGWAWAILPAVVISVLAAATQMDWKRPADPGHLLLLMLAAAVAAGLAGFAEPRAFLYLAPVVAAVLTLSFDRLAVRRANRGAVLLAFFTVLPGLVTIAELRAQTHPFKRNAAVPFDEIIDFIERNESGETLIISTDPIVPWELGKHADPRRCITHFFDAKKCLTAPEQYRSIFVISGHSDRSSPSGTLPRFAAQLATIIAGRNKIAELHVGRDEDAMLKTRLTGVPLDEFILAVDLYR